MSRKEAKGNGRRWTIDHGIQCGRGKCEAAVGKLEASCSLYTTIHKVQHKYISYRTDLLKSEFSYPGPASSFILSGLPAWVVDILQGATSAVSTNLLRRPDAMIHEILFFDSARVTARVNH